MEYVRNVDEAALAAAGDQRFNHWLLDHTSGGRHCSINYIKTPAGGGSPAGMHTHVVDQIFYILAGMMSLEIETKRLELLHELAPASTSLAILLNPSNAQAQTQETEAQRAARVIGRQVLVLKAGTEHEIERAFAALVRERAGALLVGGDTFFTSQATLFVVLTARHSIPTIYPFKSYVDAGGLMSYGTSLLDAYRQTGVYTGRVLKGEKPGDLPIAQPTKFELVINLKTARAVGIAIPPNLLARADEVIE